MRDIIEPYRHRPDADAIALAQNVRFWWVTSSVQDKPLIGPIERDGVFIGEARHPYVAIVCAADHRERIDDNGRLRIIVEADWIETKRPAAW